MDVSHIIMLEIISPTGAILAQGYFNKVESAQEKMQEISRLVLSKDTIDARTGIGAIFKDDLGTICWINVAYVAAMKVFNLKNMLKYSCELNNQREQIHREYDSKSGAGFLNPR